MMLIAKKHFFIIVLNALVLLFSLSICAEESLTKNIPQWVLNPIVENGLAATDCVPLKKDIDILVTSREAQTNALLAIAQQIEVRVEGLDKTYVSRSDKESEVNLGSSFSSVSKQLTKQSLNRARQLKWGIIDIASKMYVCSLMIVYGKENSTQALLTIKLTIDNSFRQKIPLDTEPYIFVFAMPNDISQGQAPITAVKIKLSQFPLTVKLDDQQAISDTVKLSDFDVVKVIAAVSMDGTFPVKTSDLIGEKKNIPIGSGNPISLKINRIIE